jgi:predicted nucleic acid-binding protein
MNVVLNPLSPGAGTPPSHGCGLADCLVAATAQLHGLTLATLNSKHLPMLQDVRVPYQKP